VKGTGPGILFIIWATPTTCKKVIMITLTKLILEKEDPLTGIFLW